MSHPRRWAPILLGLLVLCTSITMAQDPAEAVQIQAAAGKKVAAPGETIELIITFELAPHFHIFSVDSDFGLATGFLLESEGTLGKPVWPPPKTFNDKVLGPFEAHEESFEVRLPYTLPPGAKPGSLSIRGSIEGQTCDDSGCYQFEDISWTTTIEVRGAARPVQAPVKPPGPVKPEPVTLPKIPDVKKPVPVAAPQAPAPKGWLHSWSEAKKAATRTGRNILINFTGHF